MLHHVIHGAGKPLLILHGVTLDHRYMAEAVEPAFDGQDGWKRIYVDMPGHGRSPAMDRIRSMDDTLAVMMEFADDVIGEERFGVIGYSRGSYIARGITHLRPEQVAGAALITPGGSSSADPARLPPHQVLKPDPSIRPELTEADIWRFDNFAVIQRRDIVEKGRRLATPARALWDEAQDARVMKAFDFSFHKAGEAPAFDGPSLIVAGRQDSMSGYLDAIDLSAQFTRSTLAVLDTAGHGLAFERPDLFTALIRDWLDRVSDSF